MNRQTCLFCAYLLLASRLAWGADFVPPSEPPFFIDKERGWFWWEVEPEPTKQAEKSKPDTEAKHLPPPIPPQAIKQEQEPLKPELPPLSAEWFRKNLERYRDKAIDDPSPENVAAYYYLQRVMMDKAQRFTDVARRVVMSDPLLDENQRRPIATFAANEANYQAGLASEQALSMIAKQAGILFFLRSDCRYCHIQAPLLTLLEKRFGFKVYAVSLDGRPMPNGSYPDFRVDQGQAHLLGVVSTPALFLMKPPDGIVQLAQGAVSLDDLSGRILLAAKDNGWIDDAVYEATRGERQTPSLVPTPSVMDNEMLVNPANLIGTLKRQSGLQPVSPSPTPNPWSP
jgi:conjugal transfer pilus assembly protein TraF